MDYIIYKYTPFVLKASKIIFKHLVLVAKKFKNIEI